MIRHSAYRNVKPSVASHFPSLSREPAIDPNVHMFAEDIHLAIMPNGGRTVNKGNFAVELQGKKPDCKRAKEILGELCEFDRYDTTEIVCDAVDSLARHLSWEGQAVHEIIKDNEQIYIHGFTSKNLFKIIIWYIQIIPPADWDLWKKNSSLSIKKEFGR